MVAAVVCIHPLGGEIRVHFQCELMWHGLCIELLLCHLCLELACTAQGEDGDPLGIALLEENMCWVAEKVEEWRREAKLKGKIFVDLNSDEDE
jgi:hypothetical protein